MRSGPRRCDGAGDSLRAEGDCSEELPGSGHHELTPLWRVSASRDSEATPTRATLVAALRSGCSRRSPRGSYLDAEGVGKPTRR
ncbi:hypothetical protein EJB05_51693, partial [Eragrostis curvula]